MPIHYSEEYLRSCWACPYNLDTRIKGTILAAGLGRRLDPLTAYHLPKPMFPLGGKVPISEIWVRRLIECGITDVSLNLCVLAPTIRRHFGSGVKFGADVTYVEEQTPTGTFGGICKMALGSKAKLLPTDSGHETLAEFTGSTVIAPSGDIVTNFGSELLQEMYHIHRRAGAALTMVLTPIPPERRKDFGTVILDAPQALSGSISLSGRITNFVEKDPESPSCLNNASIYMIETELLRNLDPYRTEARVDVIDPFYDFGKHVFPAMLGRLPHVKLPKDHVLWGIQYDGPWFDVGNKRDYLDVNKQVLDGVVKVPLTYEKFPWGYLGANVSIDFSRVTIKPPVVIGNNCTIQPGAIIGPYAVIGDGWVVESGAEISNSVLWERYATNEVEDPHQVRAGIRVHESILTGGSIAAGVSASTVDVREDGQTVVLPIDYAPSEARA